MAAPADDQVGVGAGLDHLGIAQDGKDHVGDVGRIGQIDLTVRFELVGDIKDIAQYREEVLLNAANDLAIDEGVFRRVEQLEFDPALAPDHVNIKRFETLKYLFGAIGVAARVEHRQRTVAKQLIDIAGGCLLEAIDLKL